MLKLTLVRICLQIENVVHVFRQLIPRVPLAHGVRRLDDHPARREIKDMSVNDPFDYEDLDRLGTHVLVFVKEMRTGWGAAMLWFGKAMLFGAALWTL